jgi:acetyl/propionyl-CoA carboxylase alpha subunit/acetyl-CoA carboxylase carboxyltransferase component
VRRLLVANRAEIAVRIMRSAALLGLETVAVHPDDDVTCAHVARADQAVRLEGTGVGAYLDGAQLVAVAQRSGCDAVHPGYGFVSEQAGFATACEQAGLTFVGPAPDTLALFGDKTRARAQAVDLGIPVLDGTTGRTDLADAAAFLSALGPGGAVMVKARAGGGGRGIRPVTDPANLPDAWERCRSEAERAFGDGSLYVERLLTGARHLEIQLVGDGTGAVSHLGSRDCSVQRRRQKLIEMAPAPGLDRATEARLADAAVGLGASVGLRGLATVEFLVAGAVWVFLEVNPRLQVEHTVTEEVTGVDLVDAALRIAAGATLADLALDQEHVPDPRGIAVQCRVNTETLVADGTIRAEGGTLSRFDLPTGPGVRVDTHGYPGYAITPRFDSLLAKVIVTEPSGDPHRAATRAAAALAELDVAGPPTNATLLRAILADPAWATPELDTGFVDNRLPGLLARAAQLPATAGDLTDGEEPAAATSETPLAGGPDGAVAVPAPMLGSVIAVLVAEGDLLPAGAPVAVLEAMKMEHVVTTGLPGVVRAVALAEGDTVAAGQAIAYLEPTDVDLVTAGEADDLDLDRVRPDLAEAVERHGVGLDAGRSEAVARRHAKGRRTARENIGDLCDPGSFLEYGALVIAAQRRRRTLGDLIANTPADGLVTGTATIEGRPCAVMSYDYTVLAGTQGHQNHRKTDRLLDLADRRRLPLVIFAEGGGGRPGDTDVATVAGLDVPTFRKTAELVGQVPTVAIVSGWCFAGNAALAGVCDVIIAAEGASIGMGGPAMIEGGGLGVVAPGDVGPMSVQVPNGVVDILVSDDAAAVATARRYLSYFGDRTGDTVTGDTVTEGWDCADQRRLRHLIPENRVRTYPIRPVITTLVDTGSLLELRAGFGIGIITALARIEGRPVAVMANNPEHLGGAIDAEAADKATRFLQICDAHGLPVVSLCDTPGFMVGPDTERTAAVRRFGAMFVTGSRLRVPFCAVVLRKGYGLGVMAMAGGDLRAPLLTVSWPTGEFGGMGLEGGVRLGYRKELEAVADPDERRALYDELVAAAYERGKGLSTAAAFEIDDVIDPADTRSAIARAFTSVR